jgi:hypothetical protein
VYVDQLLDTVAKKRKQKDESGAAPGKRQSTGDQEPPDFGINDELATLLKILEQRKCFAAFGGMDLIFQRIIVAI